MIGAESRIDRTEFCDLSKHTLTLIPKVQSIHQWHNNLICFGGITDDLLVTNRASRIKVDKGKNTAECCQLSCKGEAPRARHSHSACFISFLGGLVVSGGRSEEDQFLNDIYILYLETLIWTKVETKGVTIPRAMHEVGVCDDRCGVIRMCCMCLVDIMIKDT